MNIPPTSISAVRCHFDCGGFGHGGLANTINDIGYDNVIQVMPGYCGQGETFYTIIYDPVADNWVKSAPLWEE